MRRFLPGAVLAILVGSTVVIAQSVEPANVENCVYVVEHDKVLCDLIDVTTTTQATTTTTAPTTTTTAGITTTSAPGLVIPPTQPYPARGSGIPYKDGGGYDIEAINADTATIWWVAKYWGKNGLTMYPGQGGWIDGDRQGYACAYGFITDADDEIVGRFAFVRGDVYGKVNDQYMSEGTRYLDGTLYTGDGNEVKDEDCTDVGTGVDYSNACRPVDERPRVGFFDASGNVLDIRDYTNTSANNVIFNLHSVSEDRVTVIACENGLVGMIVYYDSMGDGQIAHDFNGNGPFG